MRRTSADALATTAAPIPAPTAIAAGAIHPYVVERSNVRPRTASVPRIPQITSLAGSSRSEPIGEATNARLTSTGVPSQRTPYVASPQNEPTAAAGRTGPRRRSRSLVSIRAVWRTGAAAALRYARRVFRTAVVLFAHPDDGDFMCGGTVARWAAEGTEVHYVVLTDGSAGDNRPGAIREEVARVREREQRDAAAELGVRSVTFLGFRDGELAVNLDTRRAVCRELRRLRPEVLVAPDPRRWWTGDYVNHADHRAAGELAMCAVMPDVPSRPQFPELLEEGLEPYEIPRLWIVTFEDADTHVDIAPTIDTKIAALGRHVSQGGAEVGPWVRERAAQVGAPAGLAAAEGFRTFALREAPTSEGEAEA